MPKCGNGYKIVTFSDNMPSGVCKEFKGLLDATTICLKGVGTLVLIGLYNFGTIINIQISCLFVKGCDSVNQSLIGLKSNVF